MKNLSHQWLNQMTKGRKTVSFKQPECVKPENLVSVDLNSSDDSEQSVKVLPKKDEGV
jgi:hypothetical protein